MQKKAIHRAKYYFTDTLKSQLAQIPYFPITLVEAPSGFGKTTAVREFLRKNKMPQGANTYWYTCLGEPATIAWQGICDLICNVSNDLAVKLRRINMPDMETLTALASVLKHIPCDAETFLVVDNFHLVGSSIPRELIHVFSMHDNPRLHIIFITQQLGVTKKSGIRNDNVLTIGATALFFDRQGIEALFRMEGLQLSEDEFESVYLSTEGWIAAIRLQIMRFQETGTFDYTANIQQLVEAAFWNRLTQTEHEFLLSLSVLDSFTLRQAAILAGYDILPQTLETLLKTNDLIRYHPNKRSYILHSILLDYLRHRFHSEQTQDFQRRALHSAGQSFVTLAKYYHAARYFLQTGDYDTILSLPLTGEQLINQREHNLSEFIATLIEQCPDETFMKYPDTMLSLCTVVYINGQYEFYHKLCKLITSVISCAHIQTAQIRRLKGEFAMIEALGHYNDLNKMAVCYKEAASYLGDHPTRLHFPYSLGCPSVLFLFWRESGELDSEIQALESTLPVIHHLTGGSGAGAGSIMVAESLLMKGSDSEAEILCHKALYDASNHKQIGICICAELTLARVALLRGDAHAYFIATSNIENYAAQAFDQQILRMAELCFSHLGLLLNSTDQVAKWLFDMGSIRKTLYPSAAAYAYMLYSDILILNKRYNECAGFAEYVLNQRPNNASFVLQQLHLLSTLAICMLRKGNIREAQEYMNKALKIALADEIYLPLAQEPLLPLLEKAKIHYSDRKGIETIITLCNRQRKGISAIYKAKQHARSPLTPREREIAHLFSERFSAKEIARRLYISEATVRTIMRSVYSKLDVHSKTELIAKQI